MIVSLLSLELFFQSTPNAYLLIIDDIFAYYWIDDLEAGKSKNATNRNIEHVYNILKRFLRDYHINVITTKLDFNPSIAQSWPILKKYQIQSKMGSDVYTFSKRNFGKLVPVSYTHLTLPTICSV